MSAPLDDQLFDALNRQETVSECLAATVDLMCGDGIDKSGLGRVALLLDFLQREYKAANATVRAVAQASLTKRTMPG